MNKKIVAGAIILITLIAIGAVIFFRLYGQRSNGDVLWNVPAGKIPSGEVTSLRQEILKSSEISGKEFINYRKNNNYLFSIDNVKLDGDWASISASNRDKNTKEIIPTEGIGFLGRKIDGNWKIVGIDEKEFIQWLPDVPETLISKETKNYFYTLFGTPSK